MWVKSLCFCFIDEKLVTTFFVIVKWYLSVPLLFHPIHVSVIMIKETEKRLIDDCIVCVCVCVCACIIHQHVYAYS
jgi:hypothetical protein